MKVKITGHTATIGEMAFWYEDHIGEVFEVVEDEEKPEYYLTEIIEIAGNAYQHHIKKTDCVEVEE